MNIEDRRVQTRITLDPTVRARAERIATGRHLSLSRYIEILLAEDSKREKTK